jgi:hypothetical protein
LDHGRNGDVFCGGVIYKGESEEGDGGKQDASEKDYTRK